MLVIASLCLLAVQPFSLNQMPQSADGLLQLQRSAAVDYSLLADGSPLWVRFSSGLVYGYGAPLFNYFSPLSYYPAVGLQGLGLSHLQSWLLMMAAYILAAAAGMFLLGRLWTGSLLGGFGAALAYIYAPFLLFDAVARGASAELAALAALPFAVYGFTRLAFYGRRRDFGLAVLAFAFFIPLHTLITLHGTALLVIYCLFLCGSAGDKTGVFLRLALAGVLGLCLTAFYWLPALLESDAIKLGLIADELAHIDVHRHLRPLDALLALPHTADPSQQNQPIPISLGWGQLILGGSALLLSWRSGHRCRALLVMLALLVLVLVFMNTPASAGLWDSLPLIAYTQFPWRLLGLASLLLALMTGIGLWLLWQSRAAGWQRWAVVGIACLTLLLYAIPWTYTAYHADFAVNDIRDVQEFERQSGQLALSSYSEYLPITTDAAYLDALRLSESFELGGTTPRLRSSAALSILAQEWSGTAADLRLVSAQAQVIELDWLYVPGWVAEMDGQALAVFPSVPAGLVALEVPAGEFSLRIALGQTAVQSLAHLLSLLGGVMALAAGLAWRWRGDNFTAASGTSEPSQGRILLLFIAVGVGGFLFKAVVLDASHSAFKATRFGPVAEVEAVANFGSQIDLLAVDMPAGDIHQPSLAVKLYWRLHHAPLERDYASLLRMRDPQGQVVAEASSFAPGGLASTNWLPGSFVEDEIKLEIPPFTPRLDMPYSFDVALFDVETLAELSLINADGNPQDAKLQIGARLYRPADAGQIKPLGGDDASRFAALYESPELPQAATAGDELRFSWAWQKLRPLPAGAAPILMARLLWLDAGADERQVSAALELVNGYRFGDWRVGEVNRGHHRLAVPPNLPAGEYALAVQLLDDAENPLGEVVALNQAMTVAVPQRYFEAPDFASAVDVAWENGIILRGYSLEAADLRLIWQTAGILGDSWRLFVHILDEQGLIAAQWDGVPVNWTRPTTGWLPAEYVTTAHQFALPAGEYRLRVGWYDPASGERVKTGGLDALLLDARLAVPPP